MVATGVGGVMGNKGGVGISFKLYETSLCFVGSHLAAHQNKIENRNDDYLTIVKGLTPLLYQLNSQSIDITNQFDHIFWFGDLNYRIDLSREEVLKVIAEKNWNYLLKRDQLIRQMNEKTCFVGFDEETIVFRPTYKYAIGSSDGYSEEKPLRVPAWCDRVLFKSLNDQYIEP